MVCRSKAYSSKYGQPSFAFRIREKFPEVDYGADPAKGAVDLRTISQERSGQRFQKWQSGTMVVMPSGRRSDKEKTTCNDVQVRNVNLNLPFGRVSRRVSAGGVGKDIIATIIERQESFEQKT